jgi:hypothetical protein
MKEAQTLVMTDQSDKQYEYGEYAEHCLHTVRMMPNREARHLQRRMAAEWLKGTSKNSRLSQFVRI